MATVFGSPSDGGSQVGDRTDGSGHRPVVLVLVSSTGLSTSVGDGKRVSPLPPRWYTRLRYRRMTGFTDGGVILVIFQPLLGDTQERSCSPGLARLKAGPW